MFLILFELGWNAIRIQHHKNLNNQTTFDKLSEA